MFAKNLGEANQSMFRSCYEGSGKCCALDTFSGHGFANEHCIIKETFDFALVGGMSKTCALKQSYNGAKLS